MRDTSDYPRRKHEHLVLSPNGHIIFSADEEDDTFWAAAILQDKYGGGDPLTVVLRQAKQ
jgi:hypothetical protein